MRGATECAKRLKLLFSSLRSQLGKVNPPAVSDPVSQMLLGILSRDTPENKASEALDRLRAMVVDYNELRVIPPIELADVLEDFADVRLKSEDISRALNAVFAREHSVTLDHVAAMSNRDALAYLQGIDGVEPYTIARIRLLGLQQHGIPLDEAMWAFARQSEIVNPTCPLLEAQQFLERQIAREDALEFVALLREQAWRELGAAVRKGAVERISSVPPDRSARNMLQMISGADLAGDDEDLAALPAVAPEKAVAAAQKAELKPEPPARKKKPRKASAAGAKPAPAAKKKKPATTRGAAKKAPGKTSRKKTKKRASGKAATRKQAKKATKKRSSRKSTSRAKSA